MIKLSGIKLNPKNPRVIKDHKYKKLLVSLADFPEMMEKRPMVCVTDVDGKIFPIGGNMRLRALGELKYKEIPDSWVVLADDWTEEQRLEFTIKDNVGYGEWNWDDLANEWDTEKLIEWGMDLPEEWGKPDTDYSDKNKEVDTDFEGSQYYFKLEYSEEEYLELKEKIATTGKTPEQIFYESLISL
jgi:hypothetical protein